MHRRRRRLCSVVVCDVSNVSAAASAAVNWPAHSALGGTKNIANLIARVAVETLT
jgi:hypothetical protein